jgi:polyphosphate glucokinase
MGTTKSTTSTKKPAPKPAAVKKGAGKEPDKKSEAKPVSQPQKAGDKPRTLAIDVGGTGVKALVLDAKGKALTERARIETPKPATPAAILGVIKQMAKGWQFERISCGFPGVVVSGVVYTAINLGTEAWRGFPLAKKLSATFGGVPCRALNDAGVQGFGIVEGKGTEMVLTLGTGMGCALFVEGRYVPNLELAHHPFHKKKTYEEWIGMKALDHVGKHEWNERVRQVIEQVQPIFNPRVIYLGGGNAHKLHGKLPKNVKIGDNVAGLLGGIALWRET